MNTIFGLLLAMFLPIVLVAQTKHPLQSALLVFTHVTVIDATGAPAKPDMTVIIAGDRIAQLGRTRETQVPKDAKVVNASGKFLIPGLWDMHVHLDHKPTVSLDVIALVASSCGSNRGHIEPRATQ